MINPASTCDASVAGFNNAAYQLGKDAVADDKFLGDVNFYVKGVEGKVSGGEKK